MKHNYPTIVKGQIFIGSLFAVLMLLSSNAFAQDWPQFLGPDRNCTSPQKNLLRSWPETGPEILWSIDVGIGYGGPVVKDGKVYLLDRDDKTGDIMRCFDLANGKELWKYAYDAAGSFPFPGSRSIPVVDGNNVYSCGPLGDLYCININTHQPVWHKNIWKDFGGQDIPMWAITQNPVIYNDLVIVASQTASTGVVAYNKLTGDVKWTTPSLGPTGYVSPDIIKIGNESQVVMITACGGGRNEPGKDGRVAGIDPLSGKVLWEYSNFQCRIPSTGAVDAGNNKILVTGGYNAGSAMIKIVKNSDGTYKANELYTTTDFGVHTLPPVFVNGYFYGQYTTNERHDGLVCMSMDGKIMWQTKNDPKFNKGSLIVADGLILSTDGAKTLYLIEPDPSAFKPIASYEILNQGGVDGSNRMTSFGGQTQNWAPMALADGKLLVRDQSRMLCVKVVK